MKLVNGLFVPDYIAAEATTATPTPTPTAIPAVQHSNGMPRTHRMFELVLNGYSNKQALAVIRTEYGQNVPTTSASIAWCRQALKTANSKDNAQAQYGKRMLAKFTIA